MDFGDILFMKHHGVVFLCLMTCRSWPASKRNFSTVNAHDLRCAPIHERWFMDAVVGKDPPLPGVPLL